MKKMILKEKNELEIKNYVERFLNYIDVSDKTVETYKIALRQFCSYIHENNIKTPKREDIINYRDYLKTYLKPTTVNSYLIAVRNLYNYLEYEGIAKNITKNIKSIKLEQRHLKRGLSTEEIQKVLNVCKDSREKLIIKLMITTALRCNEVVNIKLEDFYQEQNVIMLKVLGKGRGGLKQDSVKIDNRLFEEIKQYIQEYNINDYLFVSTSNNNKGGKLTNKTIRLIVTDLFKKANLDMEMLSPHSTRHTSCELALENGIGLKEVSEFMRHKNIQTTLIYQKEYDSRNNIVSNVLANELFK